MTKKQSTQELLDIAEIKDDVIVLHSGGLRKIALTAGVNFDLKSEKERDILIYNYQEFLNSLDFSIQQIIHSRKINIEEYLNKLVKIKAKEPELLMKNLINDYGKFIEQFVAKNPIMSKSFFVVVPYDPVTLPSSGKKIINKML